MSGRFTIATERERKLWDGVFVGTVVRAVPPGLMIPNGSAVERIFEIAVRTADEAMGEFRRRWGVPDGRSAGLFLEGSE